MTRCVVELAGPAGAGKTTLATALRPEATRTGVDVGRLRLAAGLLSVAPVLAGARVSAPGRGWTTAELRSLAYLQAWRTKVAGRSSGVVLLDHGPVFRLAALAAFGPPMAGTGVFRQWCTRTAEAWAGLLDGVVWLDAPDEVLLSRIDARERHHRVRGADVGAARTFLARYRDAYGVVLDAVAQQGTPVLRLDTSTATPEELAAKIRETLLTDGVRRSA